MGGKAFEGVTRRILREEIEPTLRWLEDRWPDHQLNKVPHLHQAMLGSAGKSESSGDIDLNLEITAYDQAKVRDDFLALLGDQYVKPRPGNSQIFTALPILGDESRGRVQVDLMFGDFAWQEFSYFSPPYVALPAPAGYGESYFKGLYRTELIKALVAFNSDWILEEDGEVIARVGPTFFHDRGCVWRCRHRPWRRDGTARVKDFQELTREEFKAIYPSSPDPLMDVMSSPQDVTNLLFSCPVSVDPRWLDSLEQICGMIKSNYSADQSKIIIKIYLERLNNLKVEIPSDYLKRLRLGV